MKQWIIISPDADVVKNNDVCDTVCTDLSLSDPGAGKLTFTNALYDKSSKTIVSYWCCWNMNDETEQLLRAGLVNCEWREWYQGEGDKTGKETGEDVLLVKSLQLDDK